VAGLCTAPPYAQTLGVQWVLRRFLIVLHRLRSAGYVPIATTAVLVTILCQIAFPREARLHQMELSWHETLYYTLGLFVVEGNPLGYPRTLLLRLLYFFAPLVTAYAVLGAIAQLVEERVPLLFGQLHDHTVVGGLGRLGTTIARDEARHRRVFVAIDRDALTPGAADLSARSPGSVIVGDMTSAEILRRAVCHRAREVFFTSSSDIANLDAAFHVRRLAREHKVERPPTIFAHVYDAGLAETLGPQLATDDPTEADIVPFNSYRFAAKALVALLLRERLVTSLRVAPGLCLERTTWPEEDPQLCEPRPGAYDQLLYEDRRRLQRAFCLAPGEGSPDERYAIIGLGRFGRSVAEELLHTVAPSARFLVVESARGTCERQMASFGPEERARFEVIVGDAAAPDVVEAIVRFAPRAAVVCTDKDLRNLRLALELNRHEVRTMTRLFDLDAPSELARGLEERGMETVGLARLFRAAMPILTHERRLLGCLNLDVIETPEVDHLFYLARVTPEERRQLGARCMGLDELPARPGAPPPPPELGLVWYHAVETLDPNRTGGALL
jgi:Trk K+ transport system NAD-binding subunit